MYPERLVDEEEWARLYEQVKIALRAARAMLPEPDVCDRCEERCTRCGEKM